VHDSQLILSFCECGVLRSRFDCFNQRRDEGPAVEHGESVRLLLAAWRADLGHGGGISVRDEVALTQSQLKTAEALRPSMQETQKQLASALEQVKAQQAVISSSQNFVKEIFSSYRTDIITVESKPNPRYAVQTSSDGKPVVLGGKSLTPVCLLLSATPIQGTVQLQWGYAAEPRNSYFMLWHNILCTFWGDPPGNLGQQAFNVSYFPDKGDTDLIKSLNVVDGRIYADGEPLPKLGQADPDFKGNKWTRTQTN